MLKKIILTLATVTWASFASAVPVTVNLTADNSYTGGLCASAACTTITTSWATFGATAPNTGLPNVNTWENMDSVVIDLLPGTYSFAFHITDTEGPEGLLAEILSGTNSNLSSSLWEVFDSGTGALIATAVDKGVNNNHAIWNNIAGISNTASWIWGASTSNGADNVSIRTMFTVVEPPVLVSAPATLAFLLSGLAMVFMRKKLIS